MAQGECADCGTEMDVAMWDDPALSGSVVLVCVDCSEETPEDCLWDVSALEAANEEWPNEEGNPNLISDHPLEDGETWAIRNRHESFETYAHHFEASWDGEMPDGTLEDLKERVNLDERGETWDLFVHDADDREAIEAGRAALRERLDS